MANKRKQYNAEFKAKVALEAVRGEKTVPQLATQYQLHPTVIHNWKRQLLEGVSSLFETGHSSSSTNGATQAQIDELYRTIGQLKVERDFLASNSAKLGINSARPWS